ncbi:MAG: VPLPA-CTERM sorting domain-containing protein [Pseudomonadota bacterium]
MNVRTLVLAALVAGATGMSAQALSIDFEGETVGNKGDSFTIGTTTFSRDPLLDSFVQVADVGGTQTAFVPDDIPTPNGAFGEKFASGSFDAGDTGMMISFGGILSEITFDIADIDGTGGDRESFQIDYFLGGSGVGTQTFAAPLVGIVDGSVTTIMFSAATFDEIKITGTTPDGNRKIGWGLDNISATVVPLPASVFLLLGALGGLGLIARSRKSSTTA